MAEDAETGQFSIRRAHSADAAALVSLSRQLGYNATAGQIHGRLRNISGDPDQIVLVAETHGQVIGWIQGATTEPLESDRNVEVLGLVVEEQRRGEGVGRALLARIEDWAREKGAACVTLRSNIIRAGAHAFYRRLGYKITKTQHAFRKGLNP